MIINLELDKEHKEALQIVLEQARDSFDFSGGNEIYEEVIEDLLEVLDTDEI